MEDIRVDANETHPSGEQKTARSLGIPLAPPNREQLVGRIVGGEFSNIELYPWQVSLHTSKHQCGGSGTMKQRYLPEGCLDIFIEFYLCVR